jgi:hypothetical protein
MDLILEQVPAQDRGWVTLEVYRYLHSTGDAGRPSDAARAIVRRYQAGKLHKPCDMEARELVTVRLDDLSEFTTTTEMALAATVDALIYWCGDCSKEAQAAIYHNLPDVESETVWQAFDHGDAEPLGGGEDV